MVTKTIAVTLVAALAAAGVRAGEAVPACLPILPVRDVEATLRFFKEKLGIALAVEGPAFPLPGDVSLARAVDKEKKAILLLWADPELKKAEGPARVPRACIALADLARAAAAFPEAPRFDAGGTRFLVVEDPDGNRLLLAGPAASTSAAPAAGTAPAEGQGVALFNGEDLAGWHTFRQGSWTVEDGVLIGRQSESNGGGWLMTDASYENFSLSFSFRISPNANSGVCIRYPGEGAPPKTGVEIQLCEVDPAYQTGSILDVKAAPRGLMKAGWNRATIEARGSTVACSINGVEAARATIERLKAGGSIGLQVHAGPDYDGMTAEFKDLRVVVRPSPARS